jgi:CubicO group peptidase (beta-lactamase class C family)
MWALLTVGQRHAIGQNGLLYLHKGNWNGEQILEESWVKYVATHCNTESAYGAQFWLNAGGSFQMPKGHVLL